MAKIYGLSERDYARFKNVFRHYERMRSSGFGGGGFKTNTGGGGGGGGASGQQRRAQIATGGINNPSNGILKTQLYASDGLLESDFTYVFALLSGAAIDISAYTPVLAAGNTVGVFRDVNGSYYMNSPYLFNMATTGGGVDISQLSVQDIYDAIVADYASTKKVVTDIQFDGAAWEIDFKTNTLTVLDKEVSDGDDTAGLVTTTVSAGDGLTLSSTKLGLDGRTLRVFSKTDPATEIDNVSATECS